MTNTMWGGRFAASPAEVMEEINASIDFDKRLWRHDILASKAHVAMLAATGILKAKEADEIARGLGQVMAEIEGGTFTFSRALEDIHLNIESRLRELIGPVAGKLHADYQENLGKGFDGMWLRAAGLTHEQFVEVVRNSITDGEV